MAGVANPRHALDLAEPQVAVAFDEDENFTWHGRLLLIRLDSGSKWVCATPDLSVETIDLADFRVVALARAAPIPARIDGDFYGFASIPEDVLSDVRRQAALLGAAMGAAVPSAARTDSEWVVSDPSHPNFGQAVPSELLANPATSVSRDSVGLARFSDDSDTPGWVSMERVRNADHEEWREEKRAGPGRDPRTLPVRRDGSGSRYLSLREALTEVRGFSPTPPDDWPFAGPDALIELLKGIRGSGEEILGYHDYFVRQSGMIADSSIACKHRDMLSVLFHLVAWDQLNVLQSAGAQALARHILQIQRAVKRNPKIRISGG